MFGLVVKLILLSSSQTYKEMKVQHAVPHSSQMLAQQKFLTIPVLWFHSNYQVFWRVVARNLSVSEKVTAAVAAMRPTASLFSHPPTGSMGACPPRNRLWNLLLTSNQVNQQDIQHCMQLILLNFFTPTIDLKRNFFQQDQYIFTQGGVEKKEKYQVEHNIWGKTKFSGLQLLEMYRRPCGELTPRSWDW